METGYTIDLGRFTVERLKEIITTGRLLPSQQILLDDVDARFACLRQHGIENLAQLQKALKTKTAVASFAAETGLPVDYLTVLRREVNSYEPKPIAFSDFPGVDAAVMVRLQEAGIKQTKQLFPHVLTPESRRAFAEAQQIDESTLLVLTKLTDVARMKWVGPKFARLLVDSPYDTVEKVANSDYVVMYETLMRINEEKRVYKGHLGIDDMRLWVTQVVPLVPQVIQY